MPLVKNIKQYIDKCLLNFLKSVWVKVQVWWPTPTSAKVNSDTNVLKDQKILTEFFLADILVIWN